MRKTRGALFAGALAALSAFPLTGCDKLNQWLNPPPDTQAPAEPVSIARGGERFASTATLLKKHDFRTSDRANTLSPVMIAQLSAVSGDRFRLVDADADWANGDSASNPSLSPRRLILVANYSNIWVLAYEHFRNVRHTHIAFIELNGNKVQYYWSALATFPVKSLSDISKILDTPSYYMFKSASDTKTAGDDL
ncbi:MAG: hypothetical protein WC421_10165 [Elusimicrobiales bacterium]